MTYSIWRRFIRWQINLSSRFDRAVFDGMSVDGNQTFHLAVRELVPDGSAVADVGGGKSPFFSADDVTRKNLRVTGVDIDEQELTRAPPGAYEQVVVSPLENIKGPANHDVVLARSVLEHVQDGKRSIQGCASLLRPDGRLYTFCPNRRAWFARINLLLPERLKRNLLFGLFPEMRADQGFPANYDGCTPAEMRRNMEAAGLEIQEIRYFFASSYFMFLFPLYLLWRALTFPFMKLWPSRYCETFMVYAIKKAPLQEANVTTSRIINGLTANSRAFATQ